MGFFCGSEHVQTNTPDSANAFLLKGTVAARWRGYLDASASPRQSPAWPCCTYSFWGGEHKDQLRSSHKFLMVNRHVGVSVN